MGIVNVTPDSFYDGGRHFDARAAIDHGLALVEEGADILDVGGESTRPGSDSVPVEEELRRVVPVVEGIRSAVGVPLSIDTTRAEVARRAIAAGADIVNDVSAFRSDPEMAGVASRAGAAAILMHMRGTPKTMQKAPVYHDVVSEIEVFLRERVAAAREAGVTGIVVDPGIGFGKTVEHNIEILRRLGELRGIGCPILVGVSRKSFIGAVLGREPDDRLFGTMGAQVVAVMSGASILRVHDVRAARESVRVLEAILQGAARAV